MKKNKNLLITMFVMLVLVNTQVFAAGINPLLVMKDAFFELATNYVFLIIVAVIIAGTAWRIRDTGEWGQIWWGIGAIVTIAMVPTIAPGAIEYFQSWTPSTTVTVSP